MSRPGAGFTLLEVLVALAILGLAVVASIQGFAQGLRLLRVAAEHQEATLLADRKLREVVAPAAGHDSGIEGRFTWERTTAAVALPDGEATGAWPLYAVTVRVAWGATRAVELATLRLAPPPPPADNEASR